MRVALITTNLRGGGAEKAFVQIAQLLTARGHDVHLVLLEDWVEHAVDPGIRVHALTRPGKPCAKGFFGKRVAAFRLRRCLRALAREGPLDLVLSTLPFADEVTALARVPRRWHRIANTLSAEIGRLAARNPRKASRRRRRYRNLYDGANLVAVSEGVSADLREALGCTSANIVRIYNPFDFAMIRRLADEATAGLPTVPYVIHVGRFAPQKRHDLLLAAWRKVDAHEQLVLLTRPDERLDALIRQAGLEGRVVVAGFQMNPYPWIKHARLLVLCSDHEGMPNVLVEALACGTPVVSTDCPSGPREILRGPLARWLVPRGHVTALAQAITDALRDPPRLADVDLERFEAGHVIAQIERLPALARL